MAAGLTCEMRYPPNWSPLAIGSYLVHCVQNEVICAAAGPFDRPGRGVEVVQVAILGGAAHRRSVEVAAAKAPAGPSSSSSKSVAGPSRPTGPGGAVVPDRPGGE